MTTDAQRAAAEFAALDAMIHELHPRVRDVRACPDCGRPQHYTGTEYGWAHDAVIDLMRCAASPELLAEMEKCWRRDGHA